VLLHFDHCSHDFFCKVFPIVFGALAEQKNGGILWEGRAALQRACAPHTSATSNDANRVALGQTRVAPACLREIGIELKSAREEATACSMMRDVAALKRHTPAATSAQV
jgi:hypothetical protein